MSDERNNKPSASGVESYSLCAGKLALERTIPPSDDSSEVSRSGERIHAFMADMPLAGVTLTDDEERIAEKFAREEAELVAEFVGEPIRTIREERLWLRDGSFSGKPDAVFIGEEALLLIDYKSGWLNVTAAPKNLQLRSLVILVKENITLFGRPVFVSVLSRTGKPDTAEYGPADIEESEVELTKILASANGKDPKRFPGDKQCKYCRAAAANLCPELIATTSTLATMQTRELSTDDLLRVLEFIGPAKKVIASIEAAAKRRLEADINSVPGWTLEEGDIKTKVSDVAGVYVRCAAVGVTQEDFVKGTSLTKTSLKEMLKAATGRKGKSLDDLVKETTEGLVTTSQNAPSLKRI